MKKKSSQSNCVCVFLCGFDFAEYGYDNIGIHDDDQAIKSHFVSFNSRKLRHRFFLPLFFFFLFVLFDKYILVVIIIIINVELIKKSFFVLFFRVFWFKSRAHTHYVCYFSLMDFFVLFFVFRKFFNKVIISFWNRKNKQKKIHSQLIFVARMKRKKKIKIQNF